MGNERRALTALAASGLCFARLGTVLIRGEGVVDWRLVGVAAFISGAALTVATARLSRPARLAWHGLGLSVLIGRVTAADSLLLGVLPTVASARGVALHLANAVDVLRYGVPPVVAVPGLVAAVAAAMWLLGSVVAAAATSRARFSSLVPLAFYLYLALVDRRPTAPAWVLALAALVALSLLIDRPRLGHPGRLRDHRRHPLARSDKAAATLVVAVVAALGAIAPSVGAGVVPAGGAVDWRNQTGAGRPGTGSGIAASRFADLRQSVLSQSDEPVFVATITPLEAVVGPLSYWRMVTLDDYDGDTWWAAGRRPPPVGGAPTRPVVQTVRLEALRDDRLPTLAWPQALASDDPLVRSGADIGLDANVLLDGFTFPGLSYRVHSETPLIDPGWALALDSRPDPALAGFLRLPEEIDPRLAALAAQVVGDASPLEAALRIEGFLRKMSYDTRVTTGHSSLDLASWLVDPSSPNYRTGYCEQFAAAMGVLGRIAGLPTRLVIGYTTGDRVEGEEGTVLVVRARHAHAWVEVWIAGLGWIPFDPTPRADGATASLASQLALEVAPAAPPRPPGESLPMIPPGFADESAFSSFVSPAPALDPPTGASRRWPAVVAAVLAAASLPLYKAQRRRLRLRRLRNGDVEAAWWEIVDRLDDLGVGLRPAETPLEFGRRQSPELEALARSYAAARYGGKSPGDTVGRWQNAERWVRRAHPPLARWKGLWSTRSLRRR